MNTLLQFLSGKKTYVTTAAIGVLLFGTWQGWWTIPSEVYLALMAAALAFLRAGVGKGPDDLPPAPAADPKAPASASSRLSLMLAFASLALIVAGCNTTPQKVAYRAAGTAVVSVDVAMNLWGAYVAANHPPIAQELAVRSAFEKYQHSMAGRPSLSRWPPRKLTWRFSRPSPTQARTSPIWKTS
ncbi:MAG: hypothetical protein ABSA45_03225 [Verrucomicrobiota bacterium]